MIPLEDRIQSLDVSLFDSILSETSPEDKHSLLLVQKCLRHRGEYVYLEIGSHLGGSIQTHFAVGFSNMQPLRFSLDEKARNPSFRNFPWVC